jgi:hypothetical protein
MEEFDNLLRKYCEAVKAEDYDLAAHKFWVILSLIQDGGIEIRQKKLADLINITAATAATRELRAARGRRLS